MALIFAILHKMSKETVLCKYFANTVVFFTKIVITKFAAIIIFYKNKPATFPIWAGVLEIRPLEYQMVLFLYTCQQISITKTFHKILIRKSNYP